MGDSATTYDQAQCCQVINGWLSYLVSALCPKERNIQYLGLDLVMDSML